MPTRSAIVDLAHPYNKIGDGPEGPEVRCVADCLRDRILGQTIIKVVGDTIIGNDKLKLPFIITRISTHGKKLFLHDQESMVIMFSLGMTGRIQLSPGAYTRATFTLLDPQTRNGRALYFDDSRRLGRINIFTQEEYDQFRTTLGPDLLTDDLTADEWYAIFAKSDRRICDLLVDQSLIAGVGWYIMTDALYLAKVLPTRKGKSITRGEWEEIRVSVYYVIRLAYSEGGFTIRDYITPNGTKGGYHSFIYGQDKDYLHHRVICLKCGSRTLRYVAEVQK